MKISLSSKPNHAFECEPLSAVAHDQGAVRVSNVFRAGEGDLLLQFLGGLAQVPESRVVLVSNKGGITVWRVFSNQQPD